MSYNTIEQLGAGGFGKVFLVEDQDGSRFALKRFDPQQHIIDAAGEENLKRRFRREVIYQKNIEHSNVVRILDDDLDAETPFFVMELAIGTLNDELRQDRTLGGSPQKALFDILAGLEAIHNSGYIHRDLKPANVLRIEDEEGSFRYAVSDFGLISAAQTESTTLTPSHVRGGTPHYAAPELISNFKKGTHLSDIYSFGCILFDIFGGGAARIPYTEINSVTGSIGQIITRCTKKLPIRRYQNIAELRNDLYDALNDEDITFSSQEEERIIDLLTGPKDLSDEEWDGFFILLEENEQRGDSNRNLFVSIASRHIEYLRNNSPQLFVALGKDFCEFVKTHGFNFEYCDVLAGKLQVFFDGNIPDLQAQVIIALLELGTSHNRWAVEHRFVRLAGPDMPDNLAKRVRAEIEAQDIDFERKIEHLERSIPASRTDLHPVLQGILED